MKSISFLLVLIMTISLSGKDFSAYKIFDKDGNEANFQNILDDAKENEIVFFGEHHTNPICHWLQYELITNLGDTTNNQIIIGSEIFEADDQVIINEYMDSLFSYKRFANEAKMWKNFKTDYKPFFDYAFDNHIPFIATNIPRRYASLVAKKGYGTLDSLSAEAKSFICPPPFHLDTNLLGYADMGKMFGDNSHKAQNMMRAQAIKDQTMAHNISKNLKDDTIFIHINGTYHNKNFEGIIWYLREINSDYKILSIATASQKDLNELEEENKGLGDYILVIPESMTQTMR